MADYSREELLRMLKETEGQTEQRDVRFVDVRGTTIMVDDAALKSWAVVADIAKMSDMDGLHATVALMDIVCRCTDLDEDAVLAMAGGHDADFGDVAAVLAEASAVIFPKA